MFWVNIFFTLKIDHRTPDSHQAVEPRPIKCSDYYNIENTDMYYTCMTLFGQTPAPVDMAAHMVNIF